MEDEGMFDCDVMVVGCGPAGLMAVAELKEKGIDVLGVDRKPRLDVNVRSATGFFIDGQEMNGEYIELEPLQGKTKITFTKCGFSLEYSRPMEGIHHTHMISNTGSHFQATSRVKPLYHTFNPTTWLSDRYTRAKQLGVPFLSGTLAVRAQEIQDGVEVTLRAKGKTFTKTCRKLIASDGLQSRITRNLGLNRERIFFMKGPTIEYEMINVDCPLDRGDMYFSGERNLGGPGGLIAVPSPRGNGAYRFETMSALPGKNSYNMMEFFTQKSPMAGWFRNAEVVEKSGAVVEVFTSLKTPYRGNILIVGDSACYAECLYQGATACGYMAAQAMEQELQGKNGFEQYTDWWNSSFEWNKNPKRMADYGKRVFFNRFFTSEELDFLFNLTKKYPIVADELGGGVYDYTHVIADYYIGLPEVPAELKERMQRIKEADMGQIQALVSKRRD